MTLLSRKADYALLILAYLHHRQEGGNAREVAERYSLSRPFVANILKELVQKGYVTSHRGVKGGYALLRPAREVTLAEVIESVEDGFKLTVCNTHGSAEPTELCDLQHVCPMKGPLTEIHRRLFAVLRDVTLADLFESNQPRGEGLLPVLTMLTIREPHTTPA